MPARKPLRPPQRQWQHALRLASLAVLLLGLAACGAAPVHCPTGLDCTAGRALWQTAVDSVVQSNFPEESFEGVVHYEDFDNAWVTTGNQIHITARLLHALTPEERMAIAAHELGHLKAGHYYTRLGTSLATSAIFTALGAVVPGAGYLDYLVNPIVTGAFGRPQELAADRLGVDYLHNADVPAKHFIALLEYFLSLQDQPKEEFSILATHPPTPERIEAILAFYNDPEWRRRDDYALAPKILTALKTPGGDLIRKPKCQLTLAEGEISVPPSVLWKIRLARGISGHLQCRDADGREYETTLTQHNTPTLTLSRVTKR